MQTRNRVSASRITFSAKKKLILAQAMLLGGFACIASSVSALAPAMQQAKPAASAAQSESQEFPDGPGKAVFLRTCSQCHSPTNVLANGQDRQGWEDTITKMVGMGATGSDEDFTAILDYLTKNFPADSHVKVNVNKATASQLQTGLMLTQKEAEDIVAYRHKNGDFKTLDDLKKVPDVDPKKLDAKKDLVAFQ